MCRLKSITTTLIITLLLSFTGLASATLNVNLKTASGVENLAAGEYQQKSVFKRLIDQGKINFSYDDVSGSPVAAKRGGQTFERVVSNAELKATQNTGLLRGGREGENFFTNSASLNAKRAQQRLGLDGSLRDARIRFRIENDARVTGPRPAAPGGTGTAGGGREFSTNGRTEIDILRVDQLR